MNGWLTLPQSTSVSDDGSLTRNLSLGDRPVCGCRDRAERPHVGELALTATDRGLDQLRRDEVPVDLARGVQPLGFESNFSLKTSIVVRRRLSRHHSLE